MELVGVEVSPYLEMTSFNPLANITFGNILSYFPLHSGPPIILSKILVHLGATGMNRKFGEVCFIKNLSSKLMVFGNHNAIVEP
jgi:hypothetical protein